MNEMFTFIINFITCFIIINGASLRVHPPAKKPDGRIIGGHAVDITQFPYQVSIQYQDIHNCGGSIISPKFILTAAHCFDGVTENDTFIRAGTSTILKDGVLIGVKKITPHPNFSYVYFDGYDIALIELEEELEYSEKIQPVQLPDADETVKIPSVGTLSGWGTTEEFSMDMSTQLMAVDVPLVSREECMSDFPTDGINEREICAGFKEGGKDTCTGDSGGPLVINGVQVGVVSWGRGCAQPNKPGVYASTSALVLRHFIREISGV